MRTSTDLIERGGGNLVRVIDGYDYDAQAWVVGGIYQPCAHPAEMGPGCRAAALLAGARSHWSVTR